MRIGVVTFPGSLDDRDAQRAVRLADELLSNSVIEDVVAVKVAEVSA